ncbi:MAG: hypothetical protein IJ475_01880 [Bacilli bacterium]|nr:hypothetical protein [Bacilli bacterium]
MIYLSNIMKVIVSSDVLFCVVLGVLLVIAAFLFVMIYFQNKALKEYMNSLEEEFSEEVISSNELEELDLMAVTKELEEIPEDRIQLNTYEELQEEKAIISYDELIAKCNNVSIGYIDVNSNDDVLVKQVDLSSTGMIELDPIKKALNSKVSIASFDHEEDFLKALKQLNNFLN